MSPERYWHGVFTTKVLVKRGVDVEIVVGTSAVWLEEWVGILVCSCYVMGVSCVVGLLMWWFVAQNSDVPSKKWCIEVAHNTGSTERKWAIDIRIEAFRQRYQGDGLGEDYEERVDDELFVFAPRVGGGGRVGEK